MWVHLCGVHRYRSPFAAVCNNCRDDIGMLVMLQAESDGRGPVDEGVNHQFADHQFGGGNRIVIAVRHLRPDETPGQKRGCRS